MRHSAAGALSFAAMRTITMVACTSALLFSAKASSVDAETIGAHIAHFDAQGRLVYRAALTPTFKASPGGGGGIAPPVFPDSAPLVRVDLATRKVDTLGYLKIPKINMNMTRTATGGISIDLAIFWGFLLVLIALGVLAFFGRRKQKRMQAERSEQIGARSR